MVEMLHYDNELLNYLNGLRHYVKKITKTNFEDMSLIFYSFQQALYLIT